MRKSVKKVIPFLFAGCMVMSSSAFAYENEELWDAELENFVTYEGKEAIMSVKDYLNFGSEGFDVEAYAASGLGEGTIQNWTNYVAYTDPMDENVVKYWADLGITKELHNADTPESAWASYVPSAGLEEGSETKYPVLFVWHGNTNSIWVAETFGFAQYGADGAKYITVIPEASNGYTAIEEFDRILTELKENYPIDESRIYACGFSKGGYVVQNLANAYPEVLAGVASGGNVAHSPNAWTPGEVEGEWVTFTDEEIAALAEKNMPFMDYSGTFDSNNYPISVASHMDDPEEKIAGYNLWLNATGAVGEELTIEKSEEITANSDDVVEQHIGIDFTNTEVRVLNDTNYYIGTFQNEGGATVYEWVCIEGQMHWPAPSMPALVWEFFSQFSRDTETGELVY